MDLKIKLLNKYAEVPTRADTGSAGLDLRALIQASDGTLTYDILYPHSTKIFDTGIAIELPEGYEGQDPPPLWISRQTWNHCFEHPGDNRFDL